MQELFSVSFADTLLRFVICLFVNWFIVQFLYFRKSHRRDFYFTFVIISVAIFFLVYLMMGMDRGKATMGVGLGLFGIFSIMRYRTDSMPVREMTYLFVVVCLSVVHAMADSIGVDDNGKMIAHRPEDYRCEGGSHRLPARYGHPEGHLRGCRPPRQR